MTLWPFRMLWTSVHIPTRRAWFLERSPRLCSNVSGTCGVFPMAFLERSPGIGAESSFSDVNAEDFFPLGGPPNYELRVSSAFLVEGMHGPVRSALLKICEENPSGI